MALVSRPSVIAVLVIGLVVSFSKRNALEGRQAGPNAPTGLSANYTAPTLNLGWTPPQSGPTPTDYLLNFYSGMTSVYQLFSGGSPHASLTVPPDVTGQFGFTVTGYVNATPGSPSELKLFEIPRSGCTLPPTPTGFSGSISSGIATVGWNPVAGATNYLLRAGSALNLADHFNGPVGNTNVVTSPVPPGFTSHLALFAVNGCGQSEQPARFTLTETGGSPTPSCTPSATTLCLNGGRFKIEVEWGMPGSMQPATIRQAYHDGAEFWFFDPNNVDVLVQVLDRCSVNGRHWIFAGGLTNVGFHIDVADMQTGITRTYTNPYGTHFAGVQDMDSFVCQAGMD